MQKNLKIAVAADFDACYTIDTGTFPAILISFKLFLFDDKEKKHYGKCNV